MERASHAYQQGHQRRSSAKVISKGPNASATASPAEPHYDFDEQTFWSVSTKAPACHFACAADP
eukprot:scaffold44368_cov19-Tisochrysis_lutea.AAC.1